MRTATEEIMLLRALNSLIALAACTCVLGACASQAVPPPSADGYVRTTDGVNLYYRMLGAGRDTILVIHGGAMGLPLEYLASDLEPLAESHVLIFYDQRGAGRSTLVSDSARVHVSAHIADVEQVRRHFGMAQVTILGHSWGAGLGARYALEYPQHVAGLILVGPMPIRYAPHWPEFGRNLTAWMDSATRAEFLAVSEAMEAIETIPDPHATCRNFWNIYMRGYFADPHDPATLQRMRGDMCDAPSAALRNSEAVRGLTMKSLGDFDWRTDFRDVGAPVLVIAGGSEPIPLVSAEEWEAAFPDARLVLLDGAGHYPHVERPEEFFGLVGEFIRQLHRRPAGSG
jgi:proline iminopeptidase